MSKSIRIDEVTVAANGSVSVKFTRSSGALPALWGGETMMFADKEEFAARMAEAETIIGEHLALLQLAVGSKADPNLGATFKSKVTGKVAAVDLTGLTSVVSLT